MRFSGSLRSKEWQFLVYVSVQPIGPIFRGQESLDQDQIILSWMPKSDPMPIHSRLWDLQARRCGLQFSAQSIHVTESAALLKDLSWYILFWHSLISWVTHPCKFIMIVANNGAISIITSICSHVPTTELLHRYLQYSLWSLLQFVESLQFYIKFENKNGHFAWRPNVFSRKPPPVPRNRR